MRSMHLKPIAAAAALLAALAVPSARADSFFWAVNQFTTIQKLNGDTGAVADAFAVPFGSGSAASIAVVGNTGYYTLLGNANVYKVDMTTHLAGGIAFNTGDSSWMNGITTDSGGNLWFAHGGSSSLQEFNTTGTLLSTHAFPDPASSFRDGSVIYNGFLVANRGDQTGPYDRYLIPGGNGALTYLDKPFITALGGNNGIAYNGVNFYISNEQTHIVTKYDSNGAFVSQANLPAGSRYENWTFASQDIVVVPGVPEPGSYALMLAGLGVMGFIARRRSQKAGSAA